MPLFLLLSAQLSLPVISRKIITPPDHTYGTVSVRNIYCNMCRGRAGHEPRAGLVLCQPCKGKDAPIPLDLPAGEVWVSPTAVSPHWLGLIVLGGLRLCSILCLVGDWESVPSPSLSPPCSQRMSSSWGSS